MESMVVGTGKLSPGVAENGGFPRAAQFREDVFQDVCRRVTRVDEKFGNPFIGVIEQQHTACRLAISAGAADFLIVGLDRIWDVCMDNKPNLTSIDSHTKGIRCDDDAFIRSHEPLLNGFAVRNRKTGM